MTGLVGDRYELDGMLGRGGMAVVRKARDIRLDRTVAVKTLRADLSQDTPYRARFRREARSAAALSHPNIVAVYDSGEAEMGGALVPYIVMEYIEGRPLNDVLRDDGGALEPRRALEIVDEVLAALDHAHRGGIVHRDIKPANIMLTGTGSGTRSGTGEVQVKVMDFGIARPLDDAAATLTQTSQVVGTAQYMSPEQVRGERVDARTDLYSTGCLLYELLVGHPPFTGDTPAVVAGRHISDVAPPPSRLKPGLPAWADAIVTKALAKDVGERYQSATEMRADLRRALRTAPAPAPATAPLPAPLPAPALAGRPGATIVLPPAPAGDGPPGTYGEPPAGPAGGRARTAGGQGRAVAWILVTLLLAGVAAGVTYLLTAPTGGTTQVPEVIGLTRAAAERVIEQAGLRPEVRQGPSDEQPEGRVLRTEPRAGAEVDRGATVAVHVSGGVEASEVPDVVGRSEREARALLREAGFGADTRYAAAGNGAEPGTVLAQDPSGGARAKEGTTVTLRVARAPEPSSEPTNSPSASPSAPPSPSPSPGSVGPEAE